MDNRKIRVAITHGDTNGIGYEVILKAFEDPTMFDLCTPIIYGSPKVASYHRKALSLETQFSIIEKAEDARDGRLNLLSTFDEEVKVELGTPTEESDSAARKAVARAKEDLQKGTGKANTEERGGTGTATGVRAALVTTGRAKPD